MPDSSAPVLGGDQPPSTTLADPPRSSRPEQRFDALGLALWAIRLGPLLMLLAVLVAAASLSDVFLTAQNIGNVLSQTAIISIVAIGQLLVIVTRGIDLSVGSNLALASVIGAIVFDHQPSGWAVIAAMIATGLAVGAVNGIVFVWGRLPHPFIVTLATLSVARGLSLYFSHGQPNRGMPSAVNILNKRLAPWLPASTLLVAGVAIAVAFVSAKLVWGRWIYAVGGNPEGARRSGIPVKGVLISVYVLSGLLVGIASLVGSAQLNAGSPTTGDLLELDSIAAVVIGGASFLGGRGHVGNALVGALMIGVIRNAMRLLDIDVFLQGVVIGTVIVLAVEFDVLRGWVERRFQVARAAQ